MAQLLERHRQELLYENVQPKTYENWGVLPAPRYTGLLIVPFAFLFLLLLPHAAFFLHISALAFFLLLDLCFSVYLSSSLSLSVFCFYLWSISLFRAPFSSFSYSPSPFIFFLFSFFLSRLLTAFVCGPQRQRSCATRIREFQVSSGRPKYRALV